MKTSITFILVSSIYLYSCSSPASSKKEPKKTATTERVETITIDTLKRLCGDTAVLDKMHFIGILSDKDTNKYEVYTDYQEIQMAITLRSVSNIILYGQKDTFSYRIDSYNDLPYKAQNDSLFYCKKGSEFIFKFTDSLRLICTSGGCFEGGKGIPHVYR